MNIKIIVATHKIYQMPKDRCYMPLHVGREGKEYIGFVGDNTGENISAKNPYYCELTGLCWMWKNVKADYVGLSHYRRYFSNKSYVQRLLASNKFDCVITKEEMEDILSSTDLILPKKRHYWIESLYSHYAHTHYAEHLDLTRDILSRLHPEYVDTFDTIMQHTSGHMFNMFIMSREKCHAYCSWLFPILEELEQYIDIETYNSFQARLYGRVAELLLDVWVEYNQFQYTELPVIAIESVNWIRKGCSFLRAKFGGKKYDSSF